MIARTDATYGQLDRVLRSLGFLCRRAPEEPPTRLYEHKKSGAVIVLPCFPEEDRVLDYHLVMVRTMLSEFGIVDPTDFAGKLHKAG
jgi:hypothetical protein